jgi:cytochrome b561
MVYIYLLLLIDMHVLEKRTKITALFVCIHWLIVALILLSYFSIETRSIAGKTTLYHDIMKAGHFYIGFAVLFLTVSILIIKPFVRMKSINPKITSKSQKLIYKCVHIFLYGFLIVVPVLGWCMLSAKGAYIPYGIPSILSYDSELASLLKVIHVYIANTAMAIIFLHASGALYNHIILKNNTLKRFFIKNQSS